MIVNTMQNGDGVFDKEYGLSAEAGVTLGGKIYRIGGAIMVNDKWQLLYQTSGTYAYGVGGYASVGGFYNTGDSNIGFDVSGVLGGGTFGPKDVFSSEIMMNGDKTFGASVGVGGYIMGTGVKATKTEVLIENVNPAKAMEDSMNLMIDLNMCKQVGCNGNLNWQGSWYNDDGYSYDE